MSIELTLRPIRADDISFLQAVYASTREDELAVLDWTAEQKHEFLMMQFDAQHRYYQKQFPDARFDMILADGEPVGRLYVDRREDELRIIDIALLPEHRRKKIGGRLMRELLDEARRKRVAVRIHVEQNNPAMSLYTRLGFVKTGDTGVYYLMEWNPSRQESPQ